MQSRTTDIITVLRDLLFDLLVTGYMFYKVEPSSGNNNVKIKVLSPLNTFPDRNFNTPYVKDSYRVVVRYWKTKDEILRDYGKGR